MCTLRYKVGSPSKTSSPNAKSKGLSLGYSPVGGQVQRSMTQLSQHTFMCSFISAVALAVI